MPTNAANSNAWPRILAESLQAPDEPLSLAVTPGPEAPPYAVCRAAARALLDLPARSSVPPHWLAPHQVPAFERLLAIVRRYRGAVLADAVGLGKSFVALAVAAACESPVALVVPAILVSQWKSLIGRVRFDARILTHESLSAARARRPLPSGLGLIVVDEAHRFRNPATNRYRCLARWTIATPILLVTATPVYNRPADLVHLLRLFLPDDALVALGVPSLSRAVREHEPSPELAAAVARLVVARSRRRAVTGWPGLRFPARLPGRTLRVSPAEPDLVMELSAAVRQLRLPEAAGPLLRLTLLRRLASSVAALRETLRRYEAFHTLAIQAADVRFRLTRRQFRRLFPMPDAADLQLAMLPLLLDSADGVDPDTGDLETLRQLLERAKVGPDPKADALARLLTGSAQKTIVFTTAAATVRHLLRRLSATLRVGAVAGSTAWLGRGRATRREVLCAFAPVALGVTPPSAAAAVDVLVATDLLGEGLNLQDATRVVHYDLPWSPARLAQRVGRVDRLGSKHAHVTTVAFLPPEPLASAIALERRLAAKVTSQLQVGGAHVETVRGRPDEDAPLDWCDRLQRLLGSREDEAPPAPPAPPAACAMVSSTVNASVVVVRLGDLVEGLVLWDGLPAADPARVTDLLERAADAPPRPLDRAALARVLRAVAPFVRRRLATITAARWRGTDRDGAGRRLVPLVLAAARRAARRGQAERLARLDALVGRLVAGLTAGEQFVLDDLVGRREALDVQDLLAWYDHLPPRPSPDAPPAVELVGALLLRVDPARSAAHQAGR
jgi:hypothetical protein